MQRERWGGGGGGVVAKVLLIPKLVIVNLGVHYELSNSN